MRTGKDCWVRSRLREPKRSLSRMDFRRRSRGISMRRVSRRRRCGPNMERMKKGESRRRLAAGRRTRAMLNAIPSIGGMRRFAALAIKLGTSTKTNDKLEALEEYFTDAEDADKVWVIALFSGRRPKRTVNTTLLWEWCRE